LWEEKKRTIVPAIEAIPDLVPVFFSKENIPFFLATLSLSLSLPNYTTPMKEKKVCCSLYY